MAQRFKDQAEPLRDLGYDPFPVVWGTKGRVPHNWNSDDRHYDLAIYGDHGVGLRLGGTPAIDLDVTDTRMLQALLSWIADNLGASPARVGREPRLAMLFRAEPGARHPLRKLASRKYENGQGETQQVEILGTGRYLIAYNRHEQTGQPYQWSGGPLPVSSLPVLTEAKAEALIKYFHQLVEHGTDWEPVAERSKQTIAMDGDVFEGMTLTCDDDTFQKIAVTLKTLDPNMNHDDWNRVLMALHSTNHPKARGLAHAWSKEATRKSAAGGPVYDPEILNRKWNSYRAPGAKGITFASLLQKNHSFPRRTLELKAGPGSKPRIPIGSLHALKPKKVPWLWPGKIVEGGLMLLGGMPDTGKSTLTLDLATRVATGAGFPEHDPIKPRKVILASGEDDLEYTVLPRLMAAGYDPGGNHRIGQTTGIDQIMVIKPEASFNLIEDREELFKMLDEDPDIGMIILDPINTYLGMGKAGLDSFKDDDVRSALMPLVSALSVRGVTLLGVIHLNKAQGQAAMHRLTGSAAVAQIARTAYMTIRTADGRKAFSRIKSNLSPEGTSRGLYYDMLPAEVDEGLMAPRVDWEDECVKGADELLRELIDKKVRQPERDKASALIRDLCWNTWIDYSDLREQADKLDITEASLRKAAASLGVQKERKAPGEGRGFRWRLPASRQSKLLLMGRSLSAPKIPEPPETENDNE